MALWQWSTTPANNATAATAINWAEGQPPSSVNDSARQMMADVAAWYQVGPEWINYGLTPTYVNSTQFTVPGNQTSMYSVGRRVKAFVTAGTIYGTISNSVYGSLTTVTVAWDSGNLDNGVSEVDVGILNPAFSSLAQVGGSFTAAGGNLYAGSSLFTGEAHVGLQNNNTNAYHFLTNAGLYGFFDSTRSLTRFSADTLGNFTAAGNLAANSDERIKTDWEDIPDSLIEDLATVLCGKYTRIDTGDRQVGVGAQSLRRVLKEAVIDSEILSVTYGNAALVACVKLCQRVISLQKRVEQLESAK